MHPGRGEHADEGRATSYADHQGGIDETVPHGWHYYYWKATNLTGLSDQVIDIIAEHAYRAAPPRSYATMFHLGGAVARTRATLWRTSAATWTTASSSTRHGSPEQVDSVGAAETRGRGSSSTRSNPTALVSM